MSKSKNLIFDESLIFDSNISAASLRIYIYLMSIYEQEKATSTISNSDLSKELNISLTKVKESINQLVNINYISKKDNSILGDDADNIYFNFKHKFYLE